MPELKGKQAERFGRNMLRVEKKMKIRTNVSSDYQDGYIKGEKETIKDEIEFIKYILMGSNYTKEYYIQMLENRIKVLQDKEK